MNELTLEQTDRVSQYVRRNEIVFSHLCDDLVDHICCDLEDALRNGDSFEEAYRELKMSLGRTGLKEIQEETLYAVDTKYRKMKKTMKISGVAGTILLGMASVFKINHFPLAGLMLTLGGLILIFLFLPSSLMVLWKESKSGKRLFLFISIFLASALFIAGIMSKVQHWPGSGILITLGITSAILLVIPSLILNTINDPEMDIPLWIRYTGGISIAMYGAGFLLKLMHWPLAGIILTAGIIGFCVVVIPAYFHHRWGKDDFISIEAILIIATIIVFIVPGAIVSLNTSVDFEKEFMESYRINNTSYEFRVTRNDRLLAKTAIDESGRIALLHNERDLLIAQVEEVEKALLSGGAGNGNVVAEDEISSDEPDLFNYNAGINLLADGNSLITRLERELDKYKNLVGTSVGEEVDPAIIETLNLDQYLPVYKHPDKTTHYISPIAMLQSLQLLKGSILDAEAYVIRNVVQNNPITE